MDFGRDNLHVEVVEMSKLAAERVHGKAALEAGEPASRLSTRTSRKAADELAGMLGGKGGGVSRGA